MVFASTRPKRPRLSPRERLAVGREDPFGSVIVATLLVAFGITCWTMGVGVWLLALLSAVAALLVMGCLGTSGMRQVLRGDPRSLATLALAVGLPLLLAVGTVRYSTFSRDAWAADAWYRPRHAMLDDFVAENRAVGSSRDEIIALLGTPDAEYVAPSGAGELRWEFHHSTLVRPHYLRCDVGSDGRVDGLAEAAD